MSGRDVVRLVLLSAPRRPIVTKHAHRTSGVPLRVNCSCATRKQLRGPLLSVKNASPCADLELATHNSGKWFRLTKDPAGYPAWANDSTAIYFAHREPDGFWFNRVDVKSGASRRLFRVEGEKLLARWIGV